MLRSSRNEFVVEGYQVGMWMKRPAEKIREKKEQEEKEREKERRRREKEREDKEKSRKKGIEKIKSFFEKSCVQIIEKFNKELKKIEREYLREKKRVTEKEKQQSEINIEKRKEGQREKRVAEEVILETTSYPNLLPSCDSIVQEVEDIPKEQCSASIEGKLQEEFGVVSPKEVPYNFLPNMRMRHQVDIIPSAPLLTRPAFKIHEEVPPKEIEDKKIFFEEEKKKETCEEKVERKWESILFIENKVNVEVWPKQLQLIFLCEVAYFIANTFSLHSGAYSISKALILIIPREESHGFKRIMFDPGG